MSSKKASRSAVAAARGKKTKARSRGHAVQRSSTAAMTLQHLRRVAAKKAARSRERFVKNVPKRVSHAVKAVASPRRAVPRAGEAKAAAASTVGYDGEHRSKMKNLNIKKPDVVRKAIDDLLGNNQIAEYLKKNVGSVALDVIGLLATPRSDDYIAEQLGLKINTIRRILNILQGYGITNYYVAKNTNGWLLFAWFINVDKLDSFVSYVVGSSSAASAVHDDCNDYFVCSRDFKETHEVVPFDKAFEAGFRCICGGRLKRIDRAEAEAASSAAPAAPDLANE